MAGNPPAPAPARPPRTCRIRPPWALGAPEPGMSRRTCIDIPNATLRAKPHVVKPRRAVRGLAASPAHGSAAVAAHARVEDVPPHSRRPRGAPRSHMRRFGAQGCRFAAADFVMRSACGLSRRAIRRPVVEHRNVAPRSGRFASPRCGPPWPRGSEPGGAGPAQSGGGLGGPDVRVREPVPAPAPFC